MNERNQVPLPLLETGILGFDEVLSGGLPEYSFNLITGAPGAGKTTMAHQIMFANASTARPALYFTVMGEPPLKILRHQQQFGFFDPAKIGTSIRFIDLSDIVLERGLGPVLERIVQEVEAANPAIVFVDSFQAIVRVSRRMNSGALDLQSFVQRLAVVLTNWQATTFLVGEYFDDEQHTNPLYTIADSILHVSQSSHRNAIVRKLQVVKLRGLAPMPGLHTFRISEAGLQVYPRMSMNADDKSPELPLPRQTTGVAGLDALMGGGIPLGDAMLVSGPSGSGKSMLASQFIAAGGMQGENGVIAVFEEHPAEYLRRARSLGIDLDSMIEAGTLRVIYIRPLDLSPDETLHDIQVAVRELDARRVVIDSVSGFEMALSPSFREDFRESLYRLVGAVTGRSVSVMLTMEIVQNRDDLQFSPYVVSFLADNIILMRYVEIAGQLKKSLVVVKMRNSGHSTALHLYELTPQGMVVREQMQDYLGITTGVAELREGVRSSPFPGLTDRELVVLRALLELGGASAEDVARRVGVAEGPVLASALERIVSLNYAIVVEDADKNIYRPVVQGLQV